MKYEVMGPFVSYPSRVITITKRHVVEMIVSIFNYPSAWMPTTSPAYIEGRRTIYISTSFRRDIAEHGE
jgi:hypothetical protein